MRLASFRFAKILVRSSGKPKCSASTKRSRSSLGSLGNTTVCASLKDQLQGFLKVERFSALLRRWFKMMPKCFGSRSMKMAPQARPQKTSLSFKPSLESSFT